MNFYERYEKIARAHGLEPCSLEAANLFGLTKSTISSWNTKSTTPKGDTVAVIAEKLGVTTDYLLGLSDDDKTVDRPASQKTVPIRRQDPYFLQLYNRLDKSDQLKIEGVIQGLLMQDKYSHGLNAAHTRTDIDVTDEMRAHDDSLIDDDDF